MRDLPLSQKSCDPGFEENKKLQGGSTAEKTTAGMSTTVGEANKYISGVRAICSTGDRLTDGVATKLASQIKGIRQAIADHYNKPPEAFTFLMDERELPADALIRFLEFKRWVAQELSLNSEIPSDPL